MLQDAPRYVVRSYKRFCRLRQFVVRTSALLYCHSNLRERLRANSHSRVRHRSAVRKHVCRICFAAEHSRSRSASRSLTTLCPPLRDSSQSLPPAPGHHANRAFSRFASKALQGRITPRHLETKNQKKHFYERPEKSRHTKTPLRHNRCRHVRGCCHVACPGKRAANWHFD